MPAPVEAVIISGLRKGELVQLDGNNVVTPSEGELESVMTELITIAKRVSANVRAAADEAEAMRDELRPGGKEGNRGAA